MDYIFGSIVFLMKLVTSGVHWAYQLLGKMMDGLTTIVITLR